MSSRYKEVVTVIKIEIFTHSHKKIYKGGDYLMLIILFACKFQDTAKEDLIAFYWCSGFWRHFDL